MVLTFSQNVAMLVRFVPISMYFNAMTRVGNRGIGSGLFPFLVSKRFLRVSVCHFPILYTNVLLSGILRKLPINTFISHSLEKDFPFCLVTAPSFCIIWITIATSSHPTCISANAYHFMT